MRCLCKAAFQRKDAFETAKFLPKIFAWAIALLKKVRTDQADLENIVLRKVPNLCSYCLKKPCQCWNGEKPTLQDQQLRDAYYQRALGIKRSVYDFQLRFREIYGLSWIGKYEPNAQQLEIISRLFIRLIEEVGEALRFHHPCPQNVDNELADLLAWWFAIISVLPSPNDTLLAEDYLWFA